MPDEAAAAALALRDVAARAAHEVKEAAALAAQKIETVAAKAAEGAIPVEAHRALDSEVHHFKKEYQDNRAWVGERLDRTDAHIESVQKDISALRFGLAELDACVDRRGVASDAAIAVVGVKVDAIHELVKSGKRWILTTSATVAGGSILALILFLAAMAFRAKGSP